MAIRALGIVRKVDELGRITIPKELRRTLKIEIGDPLEIFADGKQIILKAYKPFCALCGDSHELVEHGGQKICKRCIMVLSDKASL